MRAIIRSLDVDSAHSLHTFTLLILIQVVRASRSAPCRLQQCIVRPTAVLTLVQQDVQCLLIDPCLGELHLCSSRDAVRLIQQKNIQPLGRYLTSTKTHSNYTVLIRNKAVMALITTTWFSFT